MPDIGDFRDVPVIEVHVKPGDAINLEDPLITLESDKATMDVPAPQAGRVRSIAIQVGDAVSEGSPILVLERAADKTSSGEPATAAPVQTDLLSNTQPPRHAADSAGRAPARRIDIQADVVVLGAGPGGYTAAFRAADLGRNTVLVERYPDLGGVCLNVGCIPSKALLHAAAVIEETRGMAEHGVNFGKPSIDLDKLRGWKDQVVGTLTRGLAGLAKQRKVQLLQGRGEFSGTHELVVDTADGELTVGFEHAIVAAGSRPVRLPGFPADHPRIIDSTGALALREVPQTLLVIGGGIIGLEMATVYHQLGATVSVVELTGSLLPGVDPDVVKPLAKRVSSQYQNIFLNTKVTGITAEDDRVLVNFDGDQAPPQQEFAAVLVAVGRHPNGHQIGAQNAGINVDERGFIAVDDQQRTNQSHIFAIGDIVGQPMLAHKATHEGRVAAEVCAGHKSYFDARVIPSVAYTDPEVAWAGVTETDAKQQGIKYGKGTFPWAASGRALGLGRSEGMTKLLFDETSGRIIGAGIVGPNAGDLIAEVALAIEMGCDAEDIGLTIHPHPTLSETIALSAEAFSGTITDLYVPKRKR